MNASDHAPEGQSDVLRSAWKRMVELDLQSSRVSKQSTQLRKWIAILGVVATFLAIVTNEVNGIIPAWAEQVLRVMLIAVPIIISVIAAYTNKFFGGANGLVMRAGSEEIKKEIYLYRTALRNHPDRDRWLSRRLTTIQRRTYKSLGGELIIEPHEGKLPMYYNPDDPNSDPGFNDLTGDEYMRYRVIDQRDWHRRKNLQLKQERLRIQFYILAMGGLGAFLAALPPEWRLASWVALTAAVASAFTGWEQLRGLDKIVTIYSRVILELTIIRDEWEAIPYNQRTEADFVTMVREAENVMWAQNMQFISTMQEAITSGQGDEAELVENMLKEGDSMTAELQAKLLEEAKGVLAQTSAELSKVVEDSAATVKGIVGSVAGTATGLQEKVKATVSEELVAFEELADDSLARATAETAAVRTTVSQTVSTATDEVAATRKLVETTTQAAATEAAAFRDTAQATVDTGLTEAAATRTAVATTTETIAAEAGAIRATVQATVTEQAAATRQTVGATAATVAAEAGAIRATVQDTVTEQAAASRKAVEGTVASISIETDALLETAQATVKVVLDESVAMRETAETSTERLTAEAASLRGTAEKGVEVAISESTGLRASAETALSKSSELKEKLEEELEARAKDLQAGATVISQKPDLKTEGLDALLGEAQAFIDEAAEEMKERMGEAVVEQIADVVAGNKGKKGGRRKKDSSGSGGA